VALKVLPEAFARDPERMARFQREAEVLASLNHPNIAAMESPKIGTGHGTGRWPSGWPVTSDKQINAAPTSSRWIASGSTVRKLKPNGNRRVKYTILNANWSHRRLDS
jgi:serine/threonine protein kinase